jgi:integrase
MSIYKRAGSSRWWCKFSVDGHLIQQSTGSPDQIKAEEFETKLRAALYDQNRLGVKPKRTWNEAVSRYIQEGSGKVLTTRQSEARILRWLDKYLSGIPLQEINGELLNKIISSKQAEGVKPRTVNSVTNLVRVILRKAVLDWEWIDRLPKFRILPEPQKRIRFLTREEWAALEAELPTHLRRMATFAIETGLRRANITGLKWSQVDLDRKIAWYHADEMKARKAHAAPLTHAAVSVLRECAGESAEFVFTYKGKTVYQTGSTAWENACRRAGIVHFRWHDLRHTWASWHIQEGTPLHVLQELGGWKTIEMVQKYAHLTVDHLSEFVQKRDGLKTFSATGRKNHDD